jgi:hypothetical protein
MTAYLHRKLTQKHQNCSWTALNTFKILKKNEVLDGSNFTYVLKKDVTDTVFSAAQFHKYKTPYQVQVLQLVIDRGLTISAAELRY